MVLPWTVPQEVLVKMLAKGEAIGKLSHEQANPLWWLANGIGYLVGVVLALG